MRICIFGIQTFLIDTLWGKVGLFHIVLRLQGIKIVLNLGQEKYFKKSYMTPLYLLKIVSPYFVPVTMTGMALCVDHGPICPNLFCLV